MVMKYTVKELSKTISNCDLPLPVIDESTKEQVGEVIDITFDLKTKHVSFTGVINNQEVSGRCL